MQASGSGRFRPGPGWARWTGCALIVVLVGALAASSGPWPVPATPSSHHPTIGFSPGGAFVTEEPATLAHDARRMAQGGARIVRIDVDWSRIEAVRGAYDWSDTDRAIDTARGAGLSVIGLVAYTPPWARAAGTTDKWPPDRVDDYARFAGVAAARYGGRVPVWEVWNEPNLASSWRPGPDPAAYADLLAAASRAIRTATPDATVLVGGLSGVVDEPGHVDPLTFLSALYRSGRGPAFDGVSVHPYTAPDSPVGMVGGPFQRLPALHDLMAENGDPSKGVWITEFGAGTGTGPDAVTPDQQKVLLADAWDLARSVPWVRSFLVYSLRDAGSDPDDEQQTFGIRFHDDSPKPAWSTFVQAAREG